MVNVQNQHQSVQVWKISWSTTLSSESCALKHVKCDILPKIDKIIHSKNSINHLVNLLMKINHLPNFRSVNKLAKSIVNWGCYNKRKVLSCPSVPPLTAHVSNLSPDQCVYSQMSICLDCLILVLTFVIYRILLYVINQVQCLPTLFLLLVIVSPAETPP